MKVSDWIDQAADKLEEAGIGTARLDSLVLVEDVTRNDRAYLLAHQEHNLTNQQLNELAIKLKRRSKHEPLAYVRGKTEFYGREFLINKNVLEPRPESETMIDLVKKLSGPQNNKLNIIDVGTGSGALAITTKLEIPKTNVSAIDIDVDCLKVAKQNANKHNVDIKFYEGDLLEPITTLQLNNQTTILLCNLPYVPDNFTINRAAMQEPKIAIFGGPDGLDYYRKLFDHIDNHKLKIKYILTESMPPQHQKLAKIARSHSFNLIEKDDFIQTFQCTI